MATILNKLKQRLVINLKKGSIILLAKGTADISDDDLSSPHLQTLLAKRDVVVVTGPVQVPVQRGVIKQPEPVKDKYLFSWNKIPGKDKEKLIKFLKQNYGISWAKTAKIEKIDEDKSIIVSTDENSLSLKINDEKTKVNLEIDNGNTYELIAKMENGELNVYE